MQSFEVFCVTRPGHLKFSGDGFGLRQDGLTLPDVKAAHRAFVDADPSSGFREDLGGANPLSVGAQLDDGAAAGASRREGLDGCRAIR